MSSESVLKKNHLVRQKEATLALKIVSTPLASLFFFFLAIFLLEERILKNRWEYHSKLSLKCP